MLEIINVSAQQDYFGMKNDVLLVLEEKSLTFYQNSANAQALQNGMDSDV